MENTHTCDTANERHFKISISLWGKGNVNGGHQTQCGGIYPLVVFRNSLWSNLELALMAEDVLLFSFGVWFGFPKKLDELRCRYDSSEAGGVPL